MIRLPGLTAAFLLVLLLGQLAVYSQKRAPFSGLQMDSLHRVRFFPMQGLQTPEPLLQSKTPAAPVTRRLPPLQARAMDPQATICFDTAARFFLMNDSVRFYSHDPYPTADGNLLISGESTLNRPPYWSKGFLMKCDYDGNVLWTRHYDSVGHVKWHYINYNRVIELQDGSILMAGGSNNPVTGNNDLILTHTDNNGNILWSKMFKCRFWTNGSGSSDYFYVQQMKQDPASGDVYLCGPTWTAGGVVIRLNAAGGTIVWSKAYKSYGSFDAPFGIDIRPDEVRYVGRFNSYSNTAVGVYRLHKATGDTIATRHFTSVDPAGTKVDFLKQDPLKVLANGNYVLTGESYGYWQYNWDGITPLYHASVLELTNNLEVVRAFNFRNTISSNSYNTRITMFPDGSGMFTMLNYLSGFSANVHYVQFRNGQIVKQRVRHYRNEGLPWENSAVRTPDGADLMVKLMGDSITNKPKLEFLKLHTSDTSSACLGYDDYSTFIHPFRYKAGSMPLEAIHDTVFRENPVKAIIATNTGADKLPACYQISYCDQLELSSPADSICLGQPLDIVIHKNMACGSIVPLDYDTALVSAASMINDSTMRLRFRRAWQGYIYGSLQGCTLMRDSLYVKVMQAPTTLDLGPDTSLCPANSLFLNARSGYASYEWQDGSTDSTYTVTQPGTYRLIAKDACGGVFYDTVTVLGRPPVPLSIGPDRSKCNEDTIHLSAPTGFLNYNWSNNYNLSSSTSRTVVVNPLQDTAYYLRAEKEPGCFAYDTVRITVYTSPPIRLGADTVFCSGTVITLDAGGGFSSYAWSTGAVTQQVAIRDKNTYTVTGTTAEGCRSMDTLVVQAVYSNPQVNLGSDTTLCADAGRVLDAGAFTAYLWSDGSKGRTLNINHLDSYSVTVTDANGCSAGDTLLVNKLLPLPASFLPADTAICSYGTVVLKPSGAYTRYAWSGGAVSASLTIERPGLYQLEVTDGNGCVGKDEILVYPKECLKGLYVPTAFTPNKDGKNDVLRAMLFGPVKQYQFTVYNRWGEVVFRTTDHLKGWDGSYRGKTQDTNVFVWVCRYQLEGEEVKVEKGSTVMIR